MIGKVLDIEEIGFDPVLLVDHADGGRQQDGTSSQEGRHGREGLYLYRMTSKKKSKLISEQHG